MIKKIAMIGVALGVLTPMVSSAKEVHEKVRFCLIRTNEQCKIYSIRENEAVPGCKKEGNTFVTTNQQTCAEWGE